MRALDSMTSLSRSPFDSKWEVLDPAFLERGVEDVARDLLGCHLVSVVDGLRTEGRIVEVEAYGGSEDPASHASARIGRTPRNGAMYGPPGTAYVYFIYGMHWCFNVVTSAPGDPQAVLVRAIEPTSGTDAMIRRRGRTRNVANGPARLCEALKIDGSFDGHPLSEPPVMLLDGELHSGEVIGVSGRIGIREGQDRPWRFFVQGHPDVSPAGSAYMATGGASEGRIRVGGAPIPGSDRRRSATP